MLEQFLTWWAARLAETLPASWRADPHQLFDGILLRVGEGGRISCARRLRGTVTRLPDGIAPPGGLTQILQLPAGYLLERSVDLPLAVARDAAQVVELDFDRLTPFAADATVWSLSRGLENKTRGTAAFDLGLVPRARLLPLLELAQLAGWRPSQLECARFDAPPRLLPLQTGRLRNHLGWGVAIGMVVLVVTGVAMPFVRQSLEISHLDARMVAVRDQADAAGRLLKRLQPGQSGADPLLVAQIDRPRALQILAAVTKSLPDDTDLISLSLQNNHLAMEGTSASAARLIGLLATQPLIQEPSFSSPVTRTADGKDAFTLTATIGGAP